MGWAIGYQAVQPLFLEVGNDHGLRSSGCLGERLRGRAGRAQGAGRDEWPLPEDAGGQALRTPVIGRGWDRGWVGSLC